MPFTRPHGNLIRANEDGRLSQVKQGRAHQRRVRINTSAKVRGLLTRRIVKVIKPNRVNDSAIDTTLRIRRFNRAKLTSVRARGRRLASRRDRARNRINKCGDLTLTKGRQDARRRFLLLKRSGTRINTRISRNLFRRIVLILPRRGNAISSLRFVHRGGITRRNCINRFLCIIASLSTMTRRIRGVRRANQRHGPRRRASRRRCFLLKEGQAGHTLKDLSSLNLIRNEDREGNVFLAFLRGGLVGNDLSELLTASITRRPFLNENAKRATRRLLVLIISVAFLRHRIIMSHDRQVASTKVGQQGNINSEGRREKDFKDDLRRAITFRRPLIMAYSGNIRTNVLRPRINESSHRMVNKVIRVIFRKLSRGSLDLRLCLLLLVNFGPLVNDLNVKDGISRAIILLVNFRVKFNRTRLNISSLSALISGRFHLRHGLILRLINVFVVRPGRFIRMILNAPTIYIGFNSTNGHHRFTRQLSKDKARVNSNRRKETMGTSRRNAINRRTD